jgi:ABC-type polysaccharide/polyol phosphate transport system ATPase subunit
VSAPAVVFDQVWKKYSRAQRFNSLRDLVPALVSGLTSGRQDGELHGQEFWALRDVSFEVRPGEALGIIGPNGAGKSTALKVLTRILRPERGRAAVHGRVGALVEIAAGFHPDLTGRENVFMQGAIMGMKRAEIQRKFDAIVDFAGVGEFIDTPVKRFSSGMNARLGFAVAAHLDPDVLLIDEVLSVGDLTFQEKCYERMRGFVRSGIAVVFVSHNLSAISSLCTNVLVLRQGAVAALAPTHEAIGIYAGMVQEAQKSSNNRFEISTILGDADGRPVTEIEAGSSLRVRSVTAPMPEAMRAYTELQVRHLESGNLIYRCQSHSVGAPPLETGRGESLEMTWTLQANLGRGHYAISSALINEQHRWVASSAPALLTVNERQSERSTVFMAAVCSGKILESVPPAGVTR